MIPLKSFFRKTTQSAQRSERISRLLSLNGFNYLPTLRQSESFSTMPPRITSRDAPVDVLIIGAGPAGLACSSSLARLLHTCIVFSSETFRNQRSKHMHGMLTWEHRGAAEFRAAARKDILANYDTTSFEDVTIENVGKLQRDDGSSLFKATDKTGKEWWGRKVVLATGIRDIMPDIVGYEQCWVSGM